MNWHSRAWLLRSLLASRIAAQNTDMMKAFFSHWAFKNKTRLIPRGVDTEKFCPGLPSRLALRQKLNIPPETVLIVCVAELIPVKGHLTLIDAVAKLPNVHLLLAGHPMDEEYVRQLKQQVNKLLLTDRVHFLGGVQDVPSLLSESDIFVLPTLGKGRMEGCPVALLEAMACGKACIATDIPGSHDLIIHEHSGLLVQPEDSEQMKHSLQMLIADTGKRQYMSQSARQRIEDQLAIEYEVARHEKLYNELLNF
jgi:glycosyltransferase involved in cell wall biosynthesis